MGDRRALSLQVPSRGQGAPCFPEPVTPTAVRGSGAGHTDSGGGWGAGRTSVDVPEGGAPALGATCSSRDPRTQRRRTSQAAASFPTKSLTSRRLTTPTHGGLCFLLTEPFQACKGSRPYFQ